MDSRPAEIRHGVLHVRRHAPATTPGGPARRLASPHAGAPGEPAGAGLGAGAGAAVVHRVARTGHLPMLHLAPTPLQRRAAIDAHAEVLPPSAEERTAQGLAAAPLPLQRLQAVRRPPQALRMLLMRQPDADIAMTGDGAFAAASASNPPTTRETAPPAHETTGARTPQHRTLGESLRSLADSVLRPGRSAHAEQRTGEAPSIQRTIASTGAGQSAPASATPPPSAAASAPATTGALSTGRPTPPLLPASSGNRPARPDELLRGAARVSTRPLPAWAAPLARRITGAPETPLLSEGHETQQALQTLGARGATLDSTVFVSEPVNEPTPQAAEILAHEFVHVSERPTAPRYFPGILDAGERLARRAGRQAMSAVGQGAQQLGGLGGAAESSSSQIGQLASAGAGRLTSAVSGAGGAASGALASARGSAEEQIQAARGMASGYTGRGISALRGGLGQATGAVRGVAGPALSRLGALPIPGASALAGSAEQGLAGLESRAGGALDSLSGAAESGLGELGGMASGALGQATQFGQDALGSAVGGVQQGVESVSDALGGVLGGAQGALGSAQGAPGAAGDAAAGSIGAMLGGGASSALDATSQMGELMELIEDRIVAEIERRGGRFQGAF